MRGICDIRGPGDEILDEAAIAAETDYGAFWAQENITFKDGITTSAALAASDIDIDIVMGYPSPYLRHPGLIATLLHSVEDYSGGQVSGLVLGTGIPEELDKLGRPVERPVKTMSETYDIIRGIIDDGRVSYDGDMFQVDNWTFRYDFQNDIPMYLAAIGPKMRELAAAKYEGVILPYNTTVDHARKVVSEMTEQLEEFGRDPDEFVFAVNILSAVTDEDSELSYEEQIGDIRQFTEFHFCSDYLKDVLAEYSGIEYDIDALRNAMRSGDREAAREIVTEDILKQVSAVGPADHCRDLIAEFEDAGITDPIVFNLGPKEVKDRTTRELSPQVS